MSESGKQITIRRERGFFAIFRKLIIDVDGTPVLKIKAGEEHATCLPSNASRLWMRLGGQRSEPFDLDQVKEREQLVIYIIPQSFQDMRKSKSIPFGIRIEQS
ncbi:hypothetical protein [Yoonia sediminilitoris]|uniref:Uncharacterized protein n=1 Tax=Yoonia sediminilitoris TaxID=1286148 RepID=A0A2T6KFV0_9RHOB|nr:hypothetical protein [Yoonia sediminilitoris]PUB14202.1 hypothetical protein C8N45_10676 [Yoonia sediminilitoris]RCW95133.1 hypothetical protein DFP92_10676 [Yoonia sediminilitoris]